MTVERQTKPQTFAKDYHKEKMPSKKRVWENFYKLLKPKKHFYNRYRVDSCLHNSGLEPTFTCCAYNRWTAMTQNVNGIETIKLIDLKQIPSQEYGS
ncbi:hypothetical protein CDAR_607821 [Caerostris darwini]|uniref:Uncharacterized protein n=1 Tax=Caerostris darwini TaxID=1538125 RepID=A0AAV4UL99_9ARAC|nr:hypothetical protein CDAR_607821 [Caerostris darwini]